MSTSINLDGYGLKSSDVAAIQAICLAVMAENPVLGGGGAVNYGDLLDATTVDLPTVNGPLAVALAAISGGGGGGSSTWAGLTDKASAPLPTDNTPLSTALNLKAPLASPGLTGVPTAPTAAAATNTTQIATTAHVFAERTNTATLTGKTLTTPTLSSPVISGTISGTYTMPTTATVVTIPPAADDTMRPAPTAWVNDAIAAAYTASGERGLSSSLGVLGESNIAWAIPTANGVSVAPNVQGMGTSVTVIDTCVLNGTSSITDPAGSRTRQRVAAAAPGPRAAGYYNTATIMQTNQGSANPNFNGRFPIVLQGGVADAFGGTFFMGIQNQAAVNWMAATEPSLMTVDFVGFGWDSTDGHGQIMWNDNTVGASKISLGATDFDDAAGTIYQVTIDKNATGTLLLVQVVNLNTGVASPVHTLSSNLPRPTVPMYPAIGGSCLVTNTRMVDFAGIFVGKFPSGGGSSGVGIRVPKIVTANTYTILQSDKGLDIYFEHLTSTAVTIPPGLTVGAPESDDGFEMRVHRRRSAGPVTVAAPDASLTFNEVPAGAGTYTLTGPGEFLTVQALSATAFEGL